MKNKILLCVCTVLIIFNVSAETGNWTELTATLTNTDFSSKFIYSSVCRVIFAIKADSLLFASEDTGKTWVAFPRNGLPRANASYPAHFNTISKDLSGNIYAGFGNVLGIYMLPKGSEVWVKSAGSSELRFNYIESGKTGVLFASGGDTLFRSIDGGQTWPSLRKGRFAGVNGNIGPSGALFALANSSRILIHSVDNGTIWDTVAVSKSGYVGAGIIEYSVATDSSVYIIDDIRDLEFSLFRYSGSALLEPKLWFNGKSSSYGFRPSICAGDDGLLYASNWSSIYFSRDKAATWDSLTTFTGTNSNGIEIFNVFSDGRVLISCDRKLYLFEPATNVVPLKWLSPSTMQTRIRVSRNLLSIFNDGISSGYRTLSIKDCAGREILRLSIEPGHRKISVDLHTFSAGYYVGCLTGSSGRSATFGFVNSR